MRMGKKPKEVKSTVNPNPQTYIKFVSDIFVHPTELLYVIVDSQNRLRMFDLPTMSLIGKSYIKISDGYSIYKCMFTKDDFGLFYTLCRKEEDVDKQLEGERIDNFVKSKSKRYNYVLNMHYLNKKGQILCSTCDVNLNGSQDRINRQQKVEAHVSNTGARKSAVELTSYQKMQKEREKFIHEYYAQQVNEKNQQAIGKQLVTDGIGDIIEQENQSERRQELESGQENGSNGKLQLGGSMEEEKMALEGMFGYLNPQILQISRYARVSKNWWGSNPKNIHFTVLCNDGFHLYSMSRKIQQIEFQETQIVVGANLYGNIDRFSTDPPAHNKHELEDVWIVFTPSSCFLIEIINSHPDQMDEEGSKQFISIFSKLSFNLDARIYSSQSTFQYESCQSINLLETSNKLVIDCPKKLCLVVSSEACLCLISYEKFSLEMIVKIKLDSFNWNTTALGTQPKLSSSINFLAIARFGVNTSTTNKYENKVMVLVGVSNTNFDEREKQKEGQKEKDALVMVNEEQPRDLEKQRRNEKREKQLKNSCVVYIYSVDIKNELLVPQTTSVMVPSFMNSTKPIESTEQLVTVLKEFPLVRKIWYCQYVENRINFVNQENQVQMVQLCRFLDGKHMGKQWVNLGYRFEALEVNELYEQLEDEFELTAEQSKDSGHNVDGVGANGVREKLSELNDWSYSFLPREVILNKGIKKLNCLDL